MTRRIPVAGPLIGGEEERAVADALSKKAISGFFGEYLPLFENEFSAYCGCAYGIATSSGTTALHLALATLSIGEGDDVLVATQTNMATFFAILYQGATPIPVDIDPRTLNLDPSLLESKRTERTRAVIVVHLFGHPCDMRPVIEFARRHNLYVIEDCAQAHGATYEGRKVGGLGDIGCFSFYANKIITTGEGGMLTLNDPSWAERARSLRGLAFGRQNKFMHHDVGYNYRMTNLQAAIGHAQLGKIEAVIAAKRRIAARYHRQLQGREDLELPVERPYARSVYWMFHLLVTGPALLRRAEIMHQLAAEGIETREGFVPANLQEIFIRRGWTRVDDCPVANSVSDRGFYLPSGPGLSDEEIDHVSGRLIAALESL